jgi:hypothetical protein
MSICRVWLVRTGLVLSALFLSALSSFAQPAPAPGPRRAGSFAQVASGGGWATTITLINMSGGRVGATIKFYDDNGRLMSLPLGYPQSGLSVVGSSEAVTIPPNGSVVIETSSDSPRALVGWADVESRGAITGYAVFSYNPPGLPASEGTVSLDTAGLQSMVIPYDNVDGFQTGLALVNQSTSLAGFTCTLFDDGGAQLATFTGGLPGLGHGALFVKELFPLSSNRRGIIRIQTTSPFTGVVLRFNPTGTFTSVPIIPAPIPMP